VGVDVFADADTDDPDTDTDDAFMTDALAGNLMTCPGTMTLVRVNLLADKSALNDTLVLDAINESESLRCTT
jgi:hypothetical protein